MAGSEAEGFYGHLMGTMSHSSCIPNPHLLISKSATPHPPPSPICPCRSPQDMMSLNLWIRHLRLSLQLLLQLQRRPFLLVCNPFVFSWGVSNKCTSARWRAARRAHQPPMLPFVHMYARYPWGWGWCVPPAANPSSTWTLSGAHQEEPFSSVE